MSLTIVLDSGPLGLLVQRPGIAQADACRAWLDRHLSGGAQAVVPEIVDYELRRELIRLGLTAAVARLDQFLLAPNVRYQPITTAAMRVAAQLWAQARRQGFPTADPQALDIDVILSAQALSVAASTPGVVVATTNVAHLSRFVPAQLWSKV
jgi:predicted nucleic acid-binding protein